MWFGAECSNTILNREFGNVRTYSRILAIYLLLYTGCLQMNGAVSKVNKKFLILKGHNVHRKQRQLSKFLMRYQQLASHAYCGASF